MKNKNPTTSNAGILEDKEIEADDTAGQIEEIKYKGIHITSSFKESYCQIFFPVFPSQTVRIYLKENGFGWSAVEQCWSCRGSKQAIHHAKKAIDKITRSKTKDNDSHSAVIYRTFHHPAAR